MNHAQRGRAGWKPEEEALLFDEIRSSESSGRPLRAVFEAVARKTGRKPNSIRNYYYARIKEKDLSTTALHAGAFVPFTREEIHSLLRTVLSAQANGISVRSCTMSMGGGDNRAMLRYQNKYRALLKNHPGLVKRAAEELRAEGVDFDPYARREKRPPQAGPDAIEKLRKAKGAEGFVECLNRLAAEYGRREAGAGAVISELREKLKLREEELMAQQGRFHALLMMYRQLVSANRDFLTLNQQGQPSESARRLAHSVADCERALDDYNA